MVVTIETTFVNLYSIGDETAPVNQNAIDVSLSVLPSCLLSPDTAFPVDFNLHSPESKHLNQEPLFVTISRKELHGRLKFLKHQPGNQWIACAQLLYSDEAEGEGNTTKLRAFFIENCSASASLCCRLLIDRCKQIGGNLE